MPCLHPQISILTRMHASAPLPLPLLPQELVHAAIGEAEGARELLEKVTAEGAGGVRRGLWQRMRSAH